MIRFKFRSRLTSFKQQGIILKYIWRPVAKHCSIILLWILTMQFYCFGRLDFVISSARPVLKKPDTFSALASKLNVGLINKGWYGMLFAREIWCIADGSSVNPKSSPRNISYTPNLSIEKRLWFKPIFVILKGVGWYYVHCLTTCFSCLASFFLKFFGWEGRL